MKRKDTLRNRACCLSLPICSSFSLQARSYRPLQTISSSIFYHHFIDADGKIDLCPADENKMIKWSAGHSLINSSTISFVISWAVNRRRDIESLVNGSTLDFIKSSLVALIREHLTFWILLPRFSLTFLFISIVGRRIQSEQRPSATDEIS